MIGVGKSSALMKGAHRNSPTLRRGLRTELLLRVRCSSSCFRVVCSHKCRIPARLQARDPHIRLQSPILQSRLTSPIVVIME